MKKEKISDKNIILIAGVAASIIMVVVVLSFSLNPTKKIPITGNSIMLKEQNTQYYTKQEMDQLIETKCPEVMSSIELSGKGNAYLCIDSKGKMFRNEDPCK